MLEEAVDIIGALFDSQEPVNYRGRYFSVETARLWDRPSSACPSASPVRDRIRAGWPGTRPT